MNASLLLIPFVTAFTGWLVIWFVIKMMFHPVNPQKFLGIPVQSIFSKRQSLFSRKTAIVISNELLSSKELEQKLGDPASFEKLIPLVDVQIDNFLRVKLTETMPYITAFIGDKTIIQLKSVFMEELQTLFPELMKNYVAQLRQDYNIEQVIEAKLNALSSQKIETLVYENLHKEFKQAKLMAALLGFIIGAIYLGFILLA